MHTATPSVTECTGLQTPVRNRYFYGKMMDVYHFDLETRYQNSKRRLLNRLISGYGVVCGLDVQWSDTPGQLVITPGVALDKAGYEIIVPEPSRPIPVSFDDAKEQQDCGDQKDNPCERCVHVVICYHECLTDPVPVLTGECSSPEPCAPGAIRERYKIEVRPGCLDPCQIECRLPDVISNYRLNCEKLAEWVTRSCPPMPKDPCIPLANVRFRRDPQQSTWGPGTIEIGVRPIVYSNDLLFDMLVCLLKESPQHRGGKS